MNNSPIDEFLDQFEGIRLSLVERFNEAKIVIQGSVHKPIDDQNFAEKLKFLNSRDRVELSVKVDNETSIEYYSQSPRATFFYDLKSLTTFFTQITYTITIIKRQVDGVMSLYFFDDFIKYLKSLATESQLHEFSTYIKNTTFLVLESQSTQIELKTPSIWFTNSGNTVMPSVVTRQEIIDKAKGVSNYNHFSDHCLIPQDFRLSQAAGSDLDLIFSKLRTACSIAFLYDITTLKGNKIDYKLKGYKSLQGAIDISTAKNDDSDQFYRIYDWVYDSGNLNDKIGIARNIISLHITDPALLELSGDPYQSVQSSYAIYQQQNIKQYIEIRNKLSDQLLSFHDRANKIIETFASGFQKSALAIVTFYSSVFLIKFLNKDDLTGIFTFEASVISTVFILCSAAYYFAAKWEVNAQVMRFADNYKNLKARYEDLLDKQDIERILNKDIEFKSDIRFMNEKKKTYTYLWFGFLTLFFLVSWFLFAWNKALLIVHFCLIAIFCWNYL